MPDWLNHPHTSYVLAAYGVAAVALLGLLVCSFRAWRSRQAEWQKLRSSSPRR